MVGVKSGYKVIDAMTTRPIWVTKDTSLFDCAKLLAEHKVSSLVVREENSPNTIQGILTVHDLAWKALAKGLDVHKTPAKALMIVDMISITPCADLFDALKIMRVHEIRQLPVMDGDKFIGYLTFKDILNIEPQIAELLLDRALMSESHSFQNTETDGICALCGEYAEKLELCEGSLICSACKQ